MKSMYKKLGDYIEPCDLLNDKEEITLLQGISNKKYFQACKSNTNDIDLSRYRICRKGWFAYNRATTRNGDKISIAYRDGEDCLVSPSYKCFRIKDENELNPYYLMLWFKRPQFDRYARFRSHGSAHEYFEYDEMCEVELPIPSIEEQLKIVEEYQTLEHRIELKRDEYLERINRIPMVNTKIKILQRLLKNAIDDYRKINKIKGVDFTERMNAVVDLYNARRKDKAFANEVLDDVAEQLTKLLEELGKDKHSFEELNITFEEKAFFDILEALAKKYGFYDEYIKNYGEEHLLNLAKDIKTIVDDKAKYAAWSAREDIKAELKVNIILKLAEYKYPPVTQDEVYKEVLEQAENFRKYID